MRGRVPSAYSAGMRGVVLLAVAPLLACAQPDDAAYPQLLPLSQLNAPPAIPAHAAEAAADPQAVGDALRARRAQTQADSGALAGPVTDAASLETRARALQSRADALRRETPAAAAISPAPSSSLPSSSAGAGTDDAADPATEARLRALRDRAGALASQPIADGAAPLPLCPPGTPVTDGRASGCRPAE